MKIAVVSDDQQAVGTHFGRSRYYIVFSVENGEIVSREVREKTGHRHGLGHGHNHAAGHDHPHTADDAHMQMVEAIRDCDAVLVGGMGGGARAAMEAAGIAPCQARASDAEAAVLAYIRDGRGAEPGCPDA